MFERVHIFINLETYIQVCISIEFTFLTKKFELLIIFQNRTHQTIITSTVFCHFFINIVRRLYVAPAIIHTPSFIFQNHSGEFNTAACRATIGRNRPNISLIPKIRKLRREHFGKSISQTTSIISFQRINHSNYIVPLSFIPCSPIGIYLSFIGYSGSFVSTSLIII